MTTIFVSIFTTLVIFSNSQALFAAEFGHCQFELLPDSGPSVEEYFSIYRTLAVDPEIESPLTGNAVFIGASCRVLVTAAHNFLLPSGLAKDGSTIDDGTGNIASQLEIDFDRSYFGTTSLREAQRNPEKDFAVIVLKKPLSTTGDCDWAHFKEMNEVEALNLREDQFTFAAYLKRYDHPEKWFYKSTCNNFEPKLESDLQDYGPDLSSNSVVLTGRPLGPGSSGGGFFLNEPARDGRKQVFALALGSYNDSRPKPQQGSPRPGELGGIYDAEFSQQNPANRIVNVGRLIEGDFAEKLREVIRKIEEENER